MYLLFEKPFDMTIYCNPQKKLAMKHQRDLSASATDSDKNFYHMPLFYNYKQDYAKHRRPRNRGRLIKEYPAVTIDCL